MSKFNSYARKLDDIAKEAFTEYRTAYAAMKKAEQRAKEYPHKTGNVIAEYAVKSARAQADYTEAKAAYDKARRNFGAAQEKAIKDLRSELAAALDDAYSADPAALDSNTLELLKSGIMSASEYAKLMSAAQAAGNATMVRLIGKYAMDAADETAAKYGQNDPKAAEFRRVSHISRAFTGSTYLNNFDYITDVFRRCTRNPAMIDRWGDLTGDAVENF